MKFAARAYRRPLSKAESDDIVAYYHELREKEGLSHEDAIRDSIVSVLMSPDFCYRFDIRSTAPGTGTVSPLTSYQLANRLSYFLWSSMPDSQLLAHAAAGDLAHPDVLLAETHRMMKDERVRGLATEFGGNWLEFRRFESITSVDRGRFPTFDNNLREAMFQEPIRLIEDAIRANRSVLDLIYGDYTFVNASLAKHYGMPAVSGGEDDWVRVDSASSYGRGGLLPMAVFLTENSPGLRTSPVKRGHWLVKDVLGEVIPPPPPVVPELPADEAKSDLPIREKLVQHRANPVCAGCHAKFDSFGLVFEGYGPIGDARTKDLAGRLIDAMATFPGGSSGSGIQGVETYIRGNRQNQYLENLSRKLLAYALNRSLQLSDEPAGGAHAAEAGSQWRSLRHPHRSHCYQSAILEPAQSRSARENGRNQRKVKQMPQSKSHSAHRISRRAVLRGAGVTMALPWLPSLSFADTANPPAFPKRFGVLFMGTGINEEHWGAEGNGADMKLTGSLEVMEPLKSKINVIDGLYIKAAMGHGIHPAQTGSLLSGVDIQKGAIIHSGVSMDQMIANTVGQDTTQSSIVLACEQPMTGYHETNYSLAYSSHISWQSPDSPVPVEVYPSLAFDSLFENRGSLRNMSILDRVKDRAEALTRQISATDKSKLDEYLTQRARSGKARRRHAQDEGESRRGCKGEQSPRGVDAPPRRRPARRSPRTRPPDVRPGGHRLPDRSHARSVAHSGARSLRADLSVHRCKGRPPRGIAR